MAYKNLSQLANSSTANTTSTNFPVIDTRDPTTNDIYYPIGKFWINQASARLWYLNKQSNMSGILQSTWQLISVSSILVSLSDTVNNVVFPSSNSAIPPNNIQFIGGTGITVVSNALTNSLTITNTGTSSSETLTGNTGGTVGPTLGNINTVGGTTIYVIGNPGTSTLTADVVSTANTILVGTGPTTASVTVGPLTNGQLLIGHTGSPPSAAVPTNGNNISWTTGAGTLRADVTGTTIHDVQIGNASGSLTSVINGTTGQVLTANTGADPTWQNPAASSVTSVTGSGNILASPTTGAVVVSLVGTTNHAIQLGNSSGSLTSASLLTNGQLLIGSTGVDPVAASLTAGTGITITPGAGSITISATGGSIEVETLTGNSGGAVSPTAGNINDIGTGSITVVGNPGTSTLTTQLTGLTANSVLYGLGTPTIGLVSSGITGQILQTNTGSAPTYSTATYPSVTTINQILYSSVNNVVSGLATTNSSSLVTSSTGVPTWLGPMTNGQLVIGSTGAIPVSNTLTAGTGITVTNGSGSITIASTNGLGISSVALDAGAQPIIPTAGGQITVTGAQVATGVVGANVIRTFGTANTATVQIQRSTTSSVSNSSLNGVSHFSSTNFTVDANGFVQFVGGSTSFPWTDEGGNFNVASNNGYFCTTTLTATLPPTPAQGDVVRIVIDTTNQITIQANTGQKIRIGNVITVLAGTAVSTKQGDAIDLVYRSASATWYAFEGTVGTWGLT